MGKLLDITYYRKQPLPRRSEPMLLEQDHCIERPTFRCSLNHPVEAWVERPERNGKGWYCGKCYMVVE